MSIVSALDDDIHSQFSGLEDQLLDAVVGGRTAMEAFIGRLSSLHKAASAAITNKSLSARTFALLRSVAQMGTTVADNVQQIQPFTDDLDAKRQEDISDVFRRMSLDDYRESTTKDTSKVAPGGGTKRSKKTSLPPSSSLNSRPPPQSSDDILLPESSSTLHKWFIDNIHCPYPSKSVRSHLAKDAGVSEPSITKWFSQMRRRSGWSALVRRHFSSNRVDAIDCAHRIFLGADAKRPVSQTLLLEFMSVKKAAEQFFEDKFKASELVKTIDDIVEDVSASTSVLCAEGQDSISSIRMDNLGGGNPTHNCMSSTKSKKRRRSPPTPPSSELSTSYDINPKRRRLTRSEKSISHLSQPTSSKNSSARLNEVHVLDSASACPTSAEQITCYPDNSSLDNPLSPNEDHGYINASSLPSPPALASCRKRRLSQHDEDEAHLSKRIRGPSFSPHMQVISDPPPSTEGTSTAVDFAQFDQIWSRAVLGGQMPSGDLDVSVFNLQDSSLTTDPSLPSADPSMMSEMASGLDNIEVGITPTGSAAFPDQSATVDSAKDGFDEMLSLLALGWNNYSVPPEVSGSPVYQGKIPSELASDFDIFPAIPDLTFDSAESTPSPTESNYSHSEFSSPSDLFSTALSEDPFSGSNSITDSQSTLSLDLSVSSGIPLDPIALSASSDCLSSSDFAQDMLKADRRAKLERLRNLKAERSRLEEEELRLDQELMSHP